MVEQEISDVFLLSVTQLEQLSPLGGSRILLRYDDVLEGVLHQTLTDYLVCLCLCLVLSAESIIQ